MTGRGDDGGMDFTTQTMAVVDAPKRDTIAPPMGPSAALVCLVGAEPGRVYPLHAGTTAIGRTDEAGVRIEGADISRQHARITWTDHGFLIEDLGSRNGTQINGVPLLQRHTLAIGDRIQIGLSAVLVFARPDDLERRAQRLQKLEGLAQLAGGLVHDFKNVLSVILMNVDLASDELAHGADLGRISESLEAIATAASAAGSLTQRLLLFARREGRPTSTRIRLVGLVDEVVSLVRRDLAGKRVTIDVAMLPTLMVRADPGELHHALLNLCLNAKDAMPGGGRLAITAREIVLNDAEAKHLHLPDPGSYVEIAIADTGVGIDEATMAHVFEPFFTTKANGTGLGLSTVFGVIRHHGGNVLVDSAPGEGACFRILLPS